MKVPLHTILESVLGTKDLILDTEEDRERVKKLLMDMILELEARQRERDKKDVV